VGESKQSLPKEKTLFICLALLLAWYGRDGVRTDYPLVLKLVAGATLVIGVCVHRWRGQWRQGLLSA
jgi:hypothetical protein